MTSRHPDDNELIKLLKDGESRNYGFSLLVNKYREKLYSHIRRLLADHDDTDDALQETFIKAWKGIESFREDSRLYTWLYRIATNEALMSLRRKKRFLFIPVSIIEYKLEEKLEADPQLKGDQIQLKLQKAILRLPEKQRVVFNLKYFEEMKYEEMSEILDTSVGALKASYHHAVKKIEQFLKQTD